MTVKVSINIVAKNEGPVIEKSISNIMAQIDSRFELIIVDNYSTDDTYEILRKFRGYNTIIERFNGNKGEARNFALSISSGDYVLALDADQIYFNLTRLIDEYIDNYSNFGVKVGRSSFPILAPKDMLLSVGGWRRLQYAEDWDLWFRLADKCKYLYLPGREYIFGQHNRDHKRNAGKMNLISHYINKYRGIFITGLPVNLNNPGLMVLFALGVIKAIPSLSLKRHYSCLKYLRKEVPSHFQNLDWDLRFQYNLLLFQSERCSDQVFHKLLNDFEKAYSSSRQR